MADEKKKTPMQQAADKMRFWHGVRNVVGLAVGVALAVVTAGRYRSR